MMKLLFLALCHLCTRCLPNTISVAAKTEDGGILHPKRVVDDNYATSDVSVAYSSREKTILRISAISASCLSVFATIVSLYWLLRMKQVFRHRLISLVIFGDFIKALFHLIFASAAMVDDHLGSESDICQISGFFIHLGAELSDFAVFFVSLHIALQVLRTPKPKAAGLLEYRHLIYTANTIIPLILVSCTFTRSKRPYVNEGFFCHLPVRPIRYRLALYWIPRYIVWVSILGLAIAMYFRIRFKLNLFEAVEKGSLTTLRADSMLSHRLDSTASDASGNLFHGTSKAFGCKVARLSRGSQDSTNYPGFSTLSWLPEEPSQLALDEIASQQNVTTCSNMPVPKAISPGSTTLMSTPNHINRTPSEVWIANSLPANPEARSRTASNSVRLKQKPSNVNTMAKSRQRIRKQLRLLFVYPIVYLSMWTIPLVSHGFRYSDRYARQPLYILSLLSLLCRVLIGTVDCIVFCIREKPWRHLSHTDGTITGSFSWRQCEKEKGRRESLTTPVSTPTSLIETSLALSPNSIQESPKSSNTLRRSGYFRRMSSDICQNEVKQAHQRLEAERIDRKKLNQSTSRSNRLTNA